MIPVRPAALLILLSLPAGAEIAAFDAGPMPPNGTLYSEDGYHFAYRASDGDADYWIVDGKIRAKGPAGSLSEDGALSADGATLATFVAVKGGWSLALNGRRVGKKAFAEAGSLTLSPSGRNVGYAAKTAQGWAVVSGQGIGPAFPEPPSLLRVSDKGTAAVVNWQGKPWLYRDHKAVTDLPDDQPALSADLRRVGYAGADASGAAAVEVDGKRYGPYASATTPVFSPDGRHFAFLAGRTGGRSDVLIVDGRPSPMTPCDGCTLVVDNAGRAFQDELLVSLDEKAQIHRFSLDGKPLGRPSRVGSSARGGHFAYSMLTGRGHVLGLDGGVLEADAPMALPVAPPAFDGEDEFHYWAMTGNRLLLVCAQVQPEMRRPTRCAAHARFAGWPSAAELLAAPPAAHP